MCILQALNDTCASGLQKLLARPGAPVDDVLFISVDRLGADVRVRRSGEYSVERLGFASVNLRPAFFLSTCADLCVSLIVAWLCCLMLTADGYLYCM